MAEELDVLAIPPQPCWTVSAATTDYPVLDRDIKVDVAIVGGGLVGITSACLLKQENLTVAIIEANRIGKGTTGHTTAKITTQHGLIYDKLIRNIGRERARQYAAANEYALAFIEELVKNNSIDCDFSRQEAYVYTREDQYIKQIEDEVRSAASLGIRARYSDEIPLPFAIKASLRFDNQAQFHPRKYLLALARGIPGGGSHIFEHTCAVHFEEGRPFTIATSSGYRVTAQDVIISSHYPVYSGNEGFFARVIPGRSFVLAITIEEKYPGGVYASAEHPGRSLRNTPYKGGELILVTEEHNRAGQARPVESNYLNLNRFAGQTFTIRARPFCWSALDYITPDGVPGVGRLGPKSSNVYVATGFRKWGITNGTAAGMLLRDLIVYGESPWQDVYDPARFVADSQFKKHPATGINPIRYLPAKLTNISLFPRNRNGKM